MLSMKDSLYFILFYLFFYFWLRWVFVAVHGISLVTASGGHSSLRCKGFPLQWLLLLGARALGARTSVAVACGLSSCGTRAQLHRGMWNLPGPGLEPLSPALEGRVLTTAPAGEPKTHFRSKETKRLKWKNAKRYSTEIVTKREQVIIYYQTKQTNFFKRLQETRTLYINKKVKYR